ncbi:alpha/beta fold hydrolase [Acidicapsa ligni]|uniref:alpha/beta fold hydrolase n=1 Tax=Acidicapsa ligni TaxID=542300 RepID=UPI0021E025BE|nr:alpha/beta hydrolase [Acidicapsa ligni]
MRFEDWDCGRIPAGEVSLFYRRAGSGHPLVLVHGCPMHSLMWHHIAPALAKDFDVIAYDQRGMGMSTITASAYDGTTRGNDLKALLDHLGIKRAHVVGFDLGAQTVASFARDNREMVERLSFIEYALPGFGYEQHMNPNPEWTIDSNWHLGLFTIPTVAEFLFSGRERQMLSWWFHHIAYSGNSYMSPEHFEAYAQTLSKPGGLRACIEHYATVWKDSKDNAVFHEKPLEMPTLALGGEASLASFTQAAWKDVASNLTSAIIPKAGHWISDENPAFTAGALRDFFKAARS